MDKGLAGDNLYVKKASYLALAMLAEGCADCIRTKYLKLFLQCICQGITEPAPVVRNAALFALGQFSEHLQVWEKKMYKSVLVKVLFLLFGSLIFIGSAYMNTEFIKKNYFKKKKIFLVTF